MIVRTRHAALLAVIVLLSALTVPRAPVAEAASSPPEPIYRLLITIRSSSTSQALFLGDPADVVTARATVKRPATAVAGVGTFGAGPLSVSRPESADRVRVRYVVAVTPAGASSLTLRSVKASSGTSTIVIANANGSDPRRIATFRHRRSHGVERILRLPTEVVAAGGAVAGTAPLSPRVHAFYYPWYLQSYWFGRAIAEYNRNERPYDSGDTEAIQRHLRQARAAGIDSFISSWFGPGTMTDDNLKILFDQLPEQGFKVGVYFETLSEDFSSKRAVLDAFRYILTNYATRPQYEQYRGKPVVYIYLPQFVLRPASDSPNPRYRRVWRQIFRTLREEGFDFATTGMSGDPRDLRVFDGLHLYSPRTTFEYNRQMGLIGRAYAAVHGGRRRTWAVTVAPGYDERHLEDRAGLFVPRNEGDHYRDQWGTAIRTHADTAVILSFNEWYETTNIEPNRRWGDLYLDITARKAARYK